MENEIAKKRIDANDVPEDVKKYLDTLVLEIMRNQRKYMNVDEKIYFVKRSRVEYKDACSWEVYELIITYSGVIQRGVSSCGSLHLTTAKSSSEYRRGHRFNILGIKGRNF